MRRLLTEGADGETTTHMARSAAVRWLDGDGAAVAELRRGAPLATSARACRSSTRCSPTRPLSLRARPRGDRDGRDAVAAWISRPALARDLAVALLVLGGRAARRRLAPLEPEPDDVARSGPGAGDRPPRAGPSSLRRRAVAPNRSSEPPLDGGPLLWDPAERTALRGPPDRRPGPPGDRPAAARHRDRRAAPARRPSPGGPRRAALAEITFLLG